MRWATYRHAPDGEDRVGLVDGDTVRALPAGAALLDLLDRLDDAAQRATQDPAEVVALADVHLRAPIPRPPSVRDFYAFEEHVATSRRSRGLEMDPDWYELPVFYFSNPHGIVDPGADVTAPPGCRKLDYELEVAAVLARGGRDLAPDEAEAAIAGYVVMNDWSARDLQQREMKLWLGPAKGKDFATTLGPFLVTPDELADRRAGNAFDCAMSASVNGREYSRGNLADLHWRFGELIAYAARGASVGAGDVFGSGTVGTGCILELSQVHGEDAYPWLRPGDEVTLTVEGIGSITNRVAAPDA